MNRRFLRRTVLGIASMLALGLIVPGVSTAQQATPEGTDGMAADGRSITVNGRGTVTIAPDSASIVVGVDVTGETLVDAQKDPTSVIPTFLHEAQGHPSYAKDPDQDYLASGVFNGVFESLPEDEQAKALKGAGPIGYGYFETEIFAELMEWGYDTPQSASDHAFDVAPDGKEYDDGRVKEVEAFLKLIRDDLEPTVADGVLSGLWLRIQRDERIIPAARGLFYATAVEVFGHEP